MEFSFRKTVITQYLLIYLMYIIPGSCLFAKYLSGNMKYIALLGLYGALIVTRKKYRSAYALYFVVLFFVSTMFTRIYTGGGAGVGTLFQFVIGVLSTQIAIYCDKEHFLARWIKLATFFAAISILFWAAFYAVPSLVDSYPGLKFITGTEGSKGYERELPGKGVFFYSYLKRHPTRNCGLFTEPGVHQIVLNMTLYVLLFWQDKLEFKNYRDYRKYVAIILVALVSCQSTTGYLGAVMILTFFFFSSRAEKKFRGIKTFMVAAVALAVTVLLVDYMTRAEESILYTQFIYKLFGDTSGGLDISEGTGKYRTGTMVVCLDIMAKYPLGVGYDRFTIMKDSYGAELVAASLMQFPAVFGIIPWVILLVLLLAPVFLLQDLELAILYTVLFVNTTLAQTDLIYPAFFMIPMYLVGTRKTQKRKRYYYGQRLQPRTQQQYPAA